MEYKDVNKRIDELVREVTGEQFKTMERIIKTQDEIIKGLREQIRVLRE